MPELIPLNIDNINTQHQNVMNSSNYGADYELTGEILKKYPCNTEKEIVALKIYLINATNSTNLLSHKNKIHISELAEIITEIKDFDKRVKEGDPELVKELARGNGKVKLFSFASKYCCYHNYLVYGKDDYYIYDTILKKNLYRYFPGMEPALIEKYRFNLNYTEYKNSLDKFIKQAGLLKYDYIRRKFDHFVWNQFREKRTED